ncbi:hypothetical protein PV10_04053 [Exophiala mesophila]|uniref:Uncharacterized protein n=1 Tax=Exophiala mesophila TaxID=212818 RepID=A0A0D1ZDJ7_EXOME|nr:uncharacterized protein PV10_04053 [Exophiala mesophila]KIV92787.1 hypothetical protein PV10_04053 [Exophiala mesophila]
MATKIMLYGGSGCSSGLAAEEMVNLSLDFTVAGLSADKVQSKAAALRAGSKVFALGLPAEVDEAIKVFTVAFNVISREDAALMRPCSLRSSSLRLEYAQTCKGTKDE